MKFIPTPKDALRARKYKLKARGIAYPTTTVWAARQAGIPLSYACALLEKESGGGRNVFGHDPTSSIPNSWKGSKVTQDKYKYYKSRRAKSGMQGVGPVQLTWWATQDSADQLGGAWKPAFNMLVGFRLLKNNIDAKGKHNGVKAYNGSGPAAKAYSNDFWAKQSWWDGKFKKD